MFVGEAPGFHEDQRVPFVGQAGKLLDRLLEGIGLTRADVFVANVLMPSSGEPRPAAGGDRRAAPHLFRQIELIEPKLVATLGNFATKLLSGQPAGITRVHGHEQEVTLGARTVLLYPLFHPAALYTPSMLKVLEEDFSRIPALLDRAADPPPADEPAPARADGRSPSSSACSDAVRPPWGLTPPRLVEVTTASAPETERVAARLAPRLRPGDVVTVSGELGREDDLRAWCLPGARHHGASDRPPRYDRPPLPGARTSRISISSASPASPAEWGDLEPYFEDAVVFVEWPEAGLAALPEARVSARLEHAGGDRRVVELSATDGALLEGFEEC